MQMAIGNAMQISHAQNLLAEHWRYASQADKVRKARIAKSKRQRKRQNNRNRRNSVLQRDGDRQDEKKGSDVRVVDQDNQGLRGQGSNDLKDLGRKDPLAELIPIPDQPVGPVQPASGMTPSEEELSFIPLRRESLSPPTQSQ